jgi:hypothetical protein
MDEVTSGDQDEVSSAEVADRFTKKTAWQYPAPSPRVGRINEDHVERSAEPTVLESVIQNEELAFKFFESDPCEGDTVGTLQVWDIGKVLFEEKSFIVGSVGRAVTSTEDGDAKVVLAKPVGDPFDDGRLARASDGEIADTDHGDGRSRGGEPTATVGDVATGHGPGVRKTGGTQEGPSQEVCWAAGITSHNSPIVIGVEHGLFLMISKLRAESTAVAQSGNMMVAAGALVG